MNSSQNNSCDSAIESDFIKFMEQIKHFGNNGIRGLLVNSDEEFSQEFIKFITEFRNKYGSFPQRDSLKEFIKFKLVEINNFYINKINEAENILKSCINNFQIQAENDLFTTEQYIYQILKNSLYPSFNSKEFELEYNELNQILIIDYKLPNIETIPKIKGFNYIASKNIFDEILLKSQELNNLYDNILYQVALRTNYEIYQNDSTNSIKNIAFNGWVQFIDKSDGLEKTSCIMSIMTNKEEFLSINLVDVEPKACFKKLKGIGSSTLYSITAIAPILKLNKKDKRFVPSYEVLNTVQDGYNLATMDWKDFENLIREIFEEEFSKNGGEVKVTQASKDGGVDAIAFDPDPIRGGKIVIQAKRYTNTVGVAAVRDLYGTVMNEGAMKGILVTTADYGSDAYDFAKDKPITLLNGNNLLHLLEKQGHKARINLKEAKQILAENRATP